MYRDGKFYSRNEFSMMLQNVLQEQRLQNIEICIMNNYRVLPSFLSRFEILVPTWLRKRIGHNVGALVSPKLTRHLLNMFCFEKYFPRYDILVLQIAY